ncbi:MAG: putative toxin-antitoxin system toxin component, PIN family [Anaerolineales bacterium]|nr:putative toxin-antitoxin system toxin component, PIN family [Anaerolineales bacterium]
MKRVVLDTNIVISSALGGALVLILEGWDDGKFTVIVTSDILSEYFEVLNRPKFRLKQETIDKIARYLYQFSEFVVPEEQIQFIEADPKDDKFLEAAIAGKVDFIVSGDKHLLDLKEFQSIPIISGREFINWLESNA